MTTITVTFIYDFYDSSIKNDKASSQQKIKNDTKQINEIQSNEKNKVEMNEEISTIVKVKKPIKYLHIEYTLLPGKLNYKVDVVFWGSIAKVFTSDGVKSMKSINENGHCWVAFSINHKLLFDEDELVKFKSCNANFLSTTSKNKVGPNAKREGEKTFYFNEEDIELKSVFAEAYEIIPEKIENTKVDTKIQNINDVQYILNDLLNFATLTESQSELYILPDEQHQLKVLKIIENISSNNIIDCLNNLEEPINVNQLLNVKKGGKEKKAKDKGKLNKPDSSQIIVPIELFFTDPYMTLYNLKLYNTDISNSYACINVQHLLNSVQKHNLRPLVIKVDKVLNMPTQILENHGFDLIYVAYNFCNINYKTGAWPISKDTCFFDHHIYFIDAEDVQQMIDFIQHEYLIFEIYGIRRVIIEKKGEMFGQNKMDKLISKPLQSCQDEVRKYNEGEKEINNKSVLLAISRVSLTDLIKPVWRICRIEQCVHPRYLNYLSPKYTLFEKVTTNELNIEYSNIFDQNPITEDLIINKNISAEVQINLLHPLVSTVGNVISNELINRIFMVIHSLDIAKTIVFNVFLHNSNWTVNNLAPNFLKPIEISEEIELKNVITGFAICGMTYYIIFLEGNRKLIYQLLWKYIGKEKTKDVDVIYNSEYRYQNRVYSLFANYGGVYFISMRTSLRYLFGNHKSFIKGHMPEPCRRAIQKLDLLVKSTYMRDIPECILPTAKELISFGVEWGVPVHWPLD